MVIILGGKSTLEGEIMNRYLSLIVKASLLLALFISQVVAQQDLSADAKTYFQQGRQHYIQNRLEQAVEALQHAIRLNPDYAEAHLLLGNVYAKLLRWKEAIESYKQSIRINPDSAEAHYNWASAYANIGSYREAVEPFKRAIQINPALFEPHLNLGVTYGKMGLFDEAIEELRRALSIRPDSAEAHYNVGVVHGRRGQWREAVEEYKQAIRIKPDYAEAHYSIGFASLIIGSYQVALDSFKQAILNKSRRTPTQLSQAYFGIGQAYAGLSSFDEALSAYRQATELNPNYAEAYNSIGAVYIQLARYREAVEALQKAIKIRPEMAGAQFQLGIAYSRLQEYDKAIEAYKQAIIIEPNHNKAYYNLGEVYARSGNKEEALKQHEALKSRDPKLAERLLNFVQTGLIDEPSVNLNQPASPVPGLPVSSTPQEEVRLTVSSPVKVITDEERKELTQKLDESVEAPMRFNNPDGVPMLIKEANAKAVRRNERYWATDGESVLSDYVMQASFTLANTTARPAKLLSLQFTNVETKQIFYVNHIVVEHQRNAQVFIPFMVLTGNPSGLSVEVAGVRFDDESGWGNYLFPQQGTKQTDKAPGDEAKAKPMAEGDTKPKLLTRLQPLYTEEARRNKVQGSVRLRLHIGADGTVKQVRVTNALPDGLTEEAIRLAYQMKFEPAMKGGVAVAFWNVMLVEFNIR